MRVLSCSFSSPGFLFPQVGLALELRARGHEVAFATGLGAQGVLAREGFPRVPRSDKDGESFNVGAWHHPVANALDIKHIEYAIARERPDVLVTHHLCLSALVAAERAGLPVAVLGSMTYLWASADPSVLAYPHGRAEGRRQWRLDEGIQTLNEVRRLFRLPPAELNAEDHALLGDVYMLRTTPRLERDLAAAPRRVHAVGPCEWEPEDDAAAGAAAWEGLRSELALPGAPLLYVHNGRSFGGPTFWPQLVEALDGAPLQVVASVARMDVERGPVPPNFLVRDHVPQGVAMQRARAVLAGGHSTVAIGAVMHGLPSLLFPYGVDTPDNAERLEACGCALVLPAEELTADDVRHGVERVLADEEMRRNCAALRDDFRAAASFARAAERVEEAASHAPARRAPTPADAGGVLAGSAA
jgi:MGT family glycosyltransferase